MGRFKNFNHILPKGSVFVLFFLFYKQLALFVSALWIKGIDFLLYIHFAADKFAKRFGHFRSVCFFCFLFEFNKRCDYFKAELFHNSVRICRFRERLEPVTLFNIVTAAELLQLIHLNIADCLAVLLAHKTAFYITKQVVCLKAERL